MYVLKTKTTIWTFSNKIAVTNSSLIEKFEAEIAWLKFCLVNAFDCVSIAQWHVAWDQVIFTKDILISHVLVTTSSCSSIIMCVNMHCHLLSFKITASTWLVVQPSIKSH